MLHYYLSICNTSKLPISFCCRIVTLCQWLFLFNAIHSFIHFFFPCVVVVHIDDDVRRFARILLWTADNCFRMSILKILLYFSCLIVIVQRNNRCVITSKHLPKQKIILGLMMNMRYLDDFRFFYDIIHGFQHGFIG